ncbi:regulatory protein, gntR family [Rubrimonas cliftonensis]|uniref:Regulatory protein, gntR family n=1 Tax=Rubrimonas cliftonensis TaxID=89524 RepID=A0A1H4F6A9_9RHOB|nr:GntR family transcriptional regulator [Rubrimonas cliftonensis]SEA92895.1 regulatory protein, gntR family [Rubrimonas cliftonensis]
MRRDGWRPDLPARSGPLYARLADAPAADIADGRLSPGRHLPIRRALGVDVKTVARAYAEAARRGLVGERVSAVQSGSGQVLRRHAATAGRGARSREWLGTLFRLPPCERVAHGLPPRERDEVDHQGRMQNLMTEVFPTEFRRNYVGARSSDHASQVWNFPNGKSPPIF